MSSNRPEYVVRVEYDGLTDLDAKIKRKAKRYWEGSGYDFREGVRDLTFYRKKKSDAIKLFSRLTTIPNIRVIIEKYPGV